MRTEQEFTLYPYDGGDDILLQSDKRLIRANLRTGQGKISTKNENYPNSQKLALNNISCQLPENVIKEIQDYLWHNEGTQKIGGGVMLFENQPLFSHQYSRKRI